MPQPSFRTIAEDDVLEGFLQRHRRRQRHADIRGLVRPGPRHARAVRSETGSIHATRPNANFFGHDAFAFRVSDGTVDTVRSDQAFVLITSPR